MGYEIQPRVERKSNAGLVLTHDEVAAAIEKDVRQRGAPTADSYNLEASLSIRNIARTAEWMGQNACSRAGECELECTGVSLLEQISQYDGQLRASCKSVECDDTGVAVAFREFTQYELP